MNNQKIDVIEKFFQHPWLIVLAIGIITVFFAFQLPKAELDNNNLRFVPENDQARLTNQYIDESFGSSFFILVALERIYSDVFDPAFLNRIREFNNTMADIDITGNINSLVSSDFIFSEDDAIVVEKLASEDFTGTPEEIDDLRQRLLSWDIYRRALISDDFKATQILIPLEISEEEASMPEIQDIFIEIRDIAKEMFADYADVYVTGLPVISAVINEAMQSDLVTMIPLVILLALVMLLFSFKNITAVLLPIITVITSVIWTMGAMPLFGIKLSVISTVLPVILVAVGSAYGIHMATHYLVELNGKTGLSHTEHRIHVLLTLKKIGKTVFLAALTTMAGFFSFCFTTVIPIREFGIFATLGVGFTFLFAVNLIPALLIIKGPSGKAPRFNKKETSGAQDWLPGHLFANIAGKKAAVIFAVILVFCFSAWGLSKLVIDNIFIEYFKTTTDIYRSDRFVREKFGGSKVINLMVEADSTEELLMPEVLLAIDNFGHFLEEQVDEVGKVMGFTDLIKRINQVFNADQSPLGLKPGLRPGLQASRNDFDDTFGFGDFGFDDFGFDDFEQNDDVPDDDPFDDDPFMEHIATNYDEMAYYEIPADPQRYGVTSEEDLSRIVANYLILLSSNISSYANDPLSPTAINTTIQLRTKGNIDTDMVLDIMQKYITENFPEYVRITIGGPALVESSLNRLVVQSQIISVIISIFVVFLIITISNKSIAAGLIGIGPLSICILINFAVMGFAGITLNIGTSMMASLCVGIGIDYTIHYMEAYKREYRISGGKGDFLLRTYTASGRAICINALSVGAGFAVLLFSQFVMLQDLGLLVALTMVSSALVSLTVIPVLLSIIKPKFIYKEL